MSRILFGFVICFFISQTGNALNLQTDDFAINLPTGWTCDPDESLVICTEANSGRQKSAIILINYKNAGVTETLAEFRNRLSKPKSTQVANGAPRLSRVVSFQDRVINGLTWIEALHFEGELPDYYTYFLATRKSKKFFLITLSAHKASWDKYRPMFENIIASLRILTPEPTPQAMPEPSMDLSNAPPMQETKSQYKGLKEMTKGLSPARLFLYASIILGCLLVLYAFRS